MNKIIFGVFATCIGRPVRHEMLDAQMAVIDDIKRKEQTLAKTVIIKNFHKEEVEVHLTEVY